MASARRAAYRNDSGEGESAIRVPRPYCVVERMTENGPELTDLHRHQRAIKRHRARFKVVACGRRWGKTTLGVHVAADMAANRRKQVWWVAPTYSLAFQVWRKFKEILAPFWSYKLEAERHIDLPGGGSITIKSADDPNSLRGVGLDYLVVDEAAYVVEEAWTASLRPALTDRRGRALLISTPRGRNWFWRLYLRGKGSDHPDWQSWQFATETNPTIDPAEIEDARALLPVRIFQQEYLAEFLEGGGEVFRRVRQAATAPTDAAPQPGHTYTMGCDWGRREDFTALAVVDATARRMVALERFTLVEWALQRERLVGLARRWRVESILAEANAMGEPNIEALQREGLPTEGFWTTGQSKPYIIESLNLAIERGDLALLPDESLLGELEAYTFEQMPSGQYRYHAPPGLHDDTVIALALAWRAASFPRLTLGMVD